MNNSLVNDDYSSSFITAYTNTPNQNRFEPSPDLLKSHQVDLSLSPNMKTSHFDDFEEIVKDSDSQKSNHEENSNANGTLKGLDNHGKGRTKLRELEGNKPSKQPVKARNHGANHETSTNNRQERGHDHKQERRKAEHAPHPKKNKPSGEPLSMELSQAEEEIINLVHTNPQLLDDERIRSIFSASLQKREI